MIQSAQLFGHYPLDEERPFAFADPDAAERGFKVTLAPRSFNTFVLD